MQIQDTATAGQAKRRVAGLALGLGAFLAILAAPEFGSGPAVKPVAAVTVLMAILWMTEAAPLVVTALIPLALFPALGVSDIRTAAAPYADPVIFLFLGGFVLGAAMERSGLHKRVGLGCAAAAGATPRRLVAGMLGATALVSMWVSNSAAAVLMMPVAMAVLALSEDHGGREDPVSYRNLGVALLLAVAYGASIGGIATLIGTPPNALLAGYMAQEHGIEIGFGQWMMVGVPVALVLLTAAWGTLVLLNPVRLVLPEAGVLFREEKARLGAMSRAEIRVCIIFALAAFAWIFRPLLTPYAPWLSDTGVAIAAAVALAFTPSGQAPGDRLVTEAELKRLPWGVLTLFGGGLSLAAAISTSGLAAWLGELLSILGGWPVAALVVMVTLAMIFLTELTSNTASAATFLPIGGALALAIGADPLLFAIPLALAASCAFMLPVATPPNAIVYGGGLISIAQMSRAGLWLNLIGVVAISLIALAAVPLIFGAR
ncbi:DASS family sodium-coupled anion symporter [Phenylobacterium sp.]|jgi:sodium-dependent dicarboxylate transporter 2/3/5|uniref:SLC13 family permease n=1 Tax=Phenylobacterium sp. TaxID=1871053 RepID=UPI000C964948|nr:DASS family sodium-coupled anion symporter [Phenylobacterium sp.]MAK81728.1 anion transporter [Phenylobacterium sp.]|tara:strand:+ start:24161 stop:25624 length:1464 start_codon:yes stop_codon:yes gene_type:complete